MGRLVYFQLVIISLILLGFLTEKATNAAAVQKTSTGNKVNSKQSQKSPPFKEVIKKGKGLFRSISIPINTGNQSGITNIKINQTVRAIGRLLPFHRPPAADNRTSLHSENVTTENSDEDPHTSVETKTEIKGKGFTGAIISSGNTTSDSVEQVEAEDGDDEDEDTLVIILTTKIQRKRTFFATTVPPIDTSSTILNDETNISETLRHGKSFSDEQRVADNSTESEESEEATPDETAVADKIDLDTEAETEGIAISEVENEKDTKTSSSLSEEVISVTDNPLGQTEIPDVAKEVQESNVSGNQSNADGPIGEKQQEESTTVPKSALDENESTELDVSDQGRGSLGSQSKGQNDTSTENTDEANPIATAHLSETKSTTAATELHEPRTFSSLSEEMGFQDLLWQQKSRKKKPQNQGTPNHTAELSTSHRSNLENSEKFGENEITDAATEIAESEIAQPKSNVIAGMEHLQEIDAIGSSTSKDANLNSEGATQAGKISATDDENNMKTSAETREVVPPPIEGNRRENEIVGVATDLPDIDISGAHPKANMIDSKDHLEEFSTDSNSTLEETESNWATKVQEGDASPNQLENDIKASSERREIETLSAETNTNETQNTDVATEVPRSAASDIQPKSDDIVGKEHTSGGNSTPEDTEVNSLATKTTDRENFVTDIDADIKTSSEHREDETTIIGTYVGESENTPVATEELGNEISGAHPKANAITGEEHIDEFSTSGNSTLEKIESNTQVHRNKDSSNELETGIKSSSEQRENLHPVVETNVGKTEITDGSADPLESEISGAQPKANVIVGKEHFEEFSTSSNSTLAETESDSAATQVHGGDDSATKLENDLTTSSEHREVLPVIKINAGENVITNVAAEVLGSEISEAQPKANAIGGMDHFQESDGSGNSKMEEANLNSPATQTQDSKTSAIEPENDMKMSSERGEELTPENSTRLGTDVQGSDVSTTQLEADSSIAKEQSQEFPTISTLDETESTTPSLSKFVMGQGRGFVGSKFNSLIESSSKHTTDAVSPAVTASLSEVELTTAAAQLDEPRTFSSFSEEMAYQDALWKSKSRKKKPSKTILNTITPGSYIESVTPSSSVQEDPASNSQSPQFEAAGVFGRNIETDVKNHTRPSEAVSANIVSYFKENGVDNMVREMQESLISEAARLSIRPLFLKV